MRPFPIRSLEGKRNVSSAHWDKEQRVLMARREDLCPASPVTDWRLTDATAPLEISAVS